MTETIEASYSQEVQQKLMDALPADGDIALTNTLIFLARLVDIGQFSKIDQTIWDESFKHAVGYRITIERQMVLKPEDAEMIV
jgi:hypothetical protein